jgi:hypothetical protein
MRATPTKRPGRPAGRSGLPEPIPGEPFSLVGTLRRTRSFLTVRDVATLLVISEKAVYARINSGEIPVANLGKLDVTRIDPAAWLAIIEHDNPHLAASDRRGRNADAPVRPRRAA